MIGDSAVAQQRSNFKNTIPSMNRFMALTSECKEQFEEEQKYISNKISFGPDKKVTFHVLNRGESLELVPEQIFGAYLKKLKTLFAKDSDKVDVVLSVPAYYSSIERQAVLDACKIANVNVLRLMNENTAVALDYGFFRRKEFTQENKNVAFLDVGHGKTTCTVASFTEKKVNILSHASDRNVGGRNFDLLLCDMIGEEFNKKFGCDPRKAPKARLRMLDQIEKTRKMLSANSEAALNIECLLEDEDIHKLLTREELEVIMQPGIDSLRTICETALKNSGLKTDQIDTIELVGEATRIPSVRKVVEEVFKKDNSQRTLNSSECVARGCSLMAAMILPHFHVSSFEITEFNALPIDLSWSVSNSNMKTKTLFPLGCNYPSVKSLTFDNRTEAMDVGLSYHSMEGMLAGLPMLLARYRVEIPTPKEEKFSLKLRVQLDSNGIPALDTTELIEEYVEIKKIPIKKDVKKAAKKEVAEGEATPTEGDKPAEEEVKPEIEYEQKEVQKSRSTQIHFKWEQHGYGVETIADFGKAEDELCKQDNLILDVKIMRNHLETYVYDMRAHLDTVGHYREFMKSEIRETFLVDLNNTEEWIYNEGESAAKEVYVSKHEELKRIGEPAKARYIYHDVFPNRCKELENVVNNVFQKVSSLPDDSHITAEEREKLTNKCQEVLEWFNISKKAHESAPKHEDPVVDLNELEIKKNEVSVLGNQILNKPVPKKEDVKADEAKPADAKDESTEKAPEAPAAADAPSAEAPKDVEMKDN
jgi:heat shock protein 4